MAEQNEETNVASQPDNAPQADDASQAANAPQPDNTPQPDTASQADAAPQTDDATTATTAAATDDSQATGEQAIEEPAAPPEPITYHAVEKDGQVSAIWEMQGRKHIRTIDPRSRQGIEILRLYTTEHHEDIHQPAQLASEQLVTDQQTSDAAAQ